MPKIGSRTSLAKNIKDTFRRRPYHWVFMLVLLVVAIPAAILTCGLLLPVKFVLKSKAFLSKWLFGSAF